MGKSYCMCFFFCRVYILKNKMSQDFPEEQFQMDVINIVHKSLVSTPHAYENGQGIAVANVRGTYFSLVATLPGHCLGFNIGILTPLRFSVG